MGLGDELDTQIDVLWIPVEWIEFNLRVLDAKPESKADEIRGGLDDNLALLKQHLEYAGGGALQFVARLLVIKRLVLGAYNQLSYLMESYLPGHPFGEIPWSYAPSPALMKCVLNDPGLVTDAKTLGRELGESLMSHLQDLLDMDLPRRDWERMYRLLQDISLRQEILPKRLYIAANKIKLEPNASSRAGGEATVTRATMKGKRKDVALRIPHHSADNVGTASDTRLQALTHYQLKHENVVPFLGVVSLGNTLAIVMPWQENGNAVDFLKAYNDSDKDEVTLNLLVDAASGLAHIHNMILPIAHGDPKGENLTVGPKFEGQWCDLGRARAVHEIQRSRSIASPGGSERYLAPEMVESKKVERPTVSSDCYAFAMVIIELTTLQPPFCERGNTLSVGPAVVAGHRPLRPETGLLAGSHGEPLWKLVEELWDGEPKRRPPMQEVVGRLREYRRNFLGLS